MSDSNIKTSLTFLLQIKRHIIKIIDVFIKVNLI